MFGAWITGIKWAQELDLKYLLFLNCTEHLTGTSINPDLKYKGEAGGEGASGGWESVTLYDDQRHHGADSETQEVSEPDLVAQYEMLLRWLTCRTMALAAVRPTAEYQTLFPESWTNHCAAWRQGTDCRKTRSIIEIIGVIAICGNNTSVRIWIRQEHRLYLIIVPL